MKNSCPFALLTGFLALITLFSPAAGTYAQTTPPPSLVRDLVTEPGEASLAASAQLASFNWIDVVSSIQAFDLFPEPPHRDGFMEYAWRVSDTLDAPWFVFVPERYDSKKPTPAVFSLHGGVGRQEFITRDTSMHTTIDDFLEDYIIQMCRERNWILIQPMARFDCLWWNQLGMEYLRGILREVKRQYNIDDNRVVVSGFSDGGSGSFHLAMLTPTDFSRFFPFSGHIGVGSYIGGMQVYPFNLARRPIYAVNGGADRLYPAAKFVKLMGEIIAQTGTDLTFTVYDTARHDEAYLRLEVPRVAEKITNQARHSFTSRIYWECDDLTFGRCDWLEITELDASLPVAAWHKQFNSQMIDDGLTIGFMADRAFEGEGVRVESLSDDEKAPARATGLLAGDVLIALDQMEIKDYMGLETAKAAKKRGDSFTMTVKRGEETVTLNGQFPPVGHDVFKYPHPSGAVEVIRSGNRFDVKGSRVKALSIFIHPDMVRLDQPVEVFVEGKEVFKSIVEPDVEFLLKEFLKDHDRKLLWAGRIDVRL